MKYLFDSGGKLHWMKNLYRRWRFGGGCCDIFNLDHYLAEKILPPLKEFRKNVASYPGDMTAEEWDNTLDEMIWAFQYYLDGEDYPDGDFKEAKRLGEREQKGFELFGKHFRSLWK